jgi:hypothetical protein
MQAAHAAATRSEPAELAGKRGPERLVVLLNENRGPLREPLDCLVEPYSNRGQNTPQEDAKILQVPRSFATRRRASARP